MKDAGQAVSIRQIGNFLLPYYVLVSRTLAISSHAVHGGTMAAECSSKILPNLTLARSASKGHKCHAFSWCPLLALRASEMRNFEAGESG